VRFLVDDRLVLARVASRSVTADAAVLWHWPEASPGERQMRAWIEAHPPVTPIVVRYDPQDPATAVLVDADMPPGGPRTPGNLRLLGLVATLCVMMVGIGIVVRSRRGRA